MKLTKWFSSIAILTGIAATSMQASAQDLQNYFDQMQNLEGNFTQVVFDNKGEQIEQSSGKLSLAKPGKAYWDYNQPYQQKLITNGNKVWHYDMDLEQVTVRNLSEYTGQIPTSLLTGVKRISDDFNVQQMRDMGDGLQRWDLTPKNTDSDFKSMMLGLSEDGKLKRIEVVNRQDQLTMLNLSNVQENVRIPDGYFDFTPPAGVDVFQ